MSLWVILKNVKDGDRELELRTSGRKFSLYYCTGNGNNIALKTGIEDRDYAIYLFNLFKEDLGFDKKKQQTKITCNKIKDVIKEVIKKNLKLK